MSRKKNIPGRNVCENLRDLFLALNPLLADGIQKLPEALANNSETELKVDYASLFVGPFKLLAAPYGSVYLEKDRQVLGDSTLAVQRCYEDAGLSLDIHEPADHIAIELEFLYFLSTSEAEAQMAGHDANAERLRIMQISFIKDFMGWLPEFCKQIENGAQTDFYKLLGQCLASFFRYCTDDYYAEPVI